MRFLIPVLIVSTCWAQFPPDLRGGPAFPPAMRVDPVTAQYTGPFYPLENEPRAFRTQMATSRPQEAVHEFAGDDGILIGFQCTVVAGAQGGEITSLLPYYSVRGEQRFGKIIGDNSRGATAGLMAREGYAVARVDTWHMPLLRPMAGVDETTPWLSALQMTFARQEADGTLSLTDQYISPLIGTQAGRRHVLDTQRFPAAGLRAAYTPKPSALGLLVSAQRVLEKKPGLAPAPLAGAGAGTPGTPSESSSAAQTGTPIASLIPPVPSAPTSPPLAPVPSANPTAPTGMTSFFGTPALPAAAAPVDQPRNAELTARAGEAFAFVEGEGGAGSAFICLHNGKRILYTNQHVIRENGGLKFTQLNQAQVKLGPAKAAVGHDLIGFEIADPLPALEVVENFAANIAIDDAVLVVGNTEGQRVIKPLPGKIIGIGPNLVEISSEFLPGNSGSPIIHVKSGRVIGIATYAVIRTVDSLTGGRNASVRRFGYRLDSVQQWQPVNWAQYQAEAALSTKIHEFSDAILGLLKDVREGKLDPGRYADMRLSNALAFLAPLTRGGNRNQADTAQAVKNFLGELKNVSLRDVQAARAQIRYDFFQTEIAEEVKLREALAKALGGALNRR